jgi:hypothetical protein
VREARPSPILELRSAGRPIPFASIQTGALNMFDYICALNSPPAGAHYLITNPP